MTQKAATAAALPELLPHSLDRDVTIHAPREVVFRFLSDSGRWARWWGPGSTIDPRVDGDVYIRHANGIEARGTVLEIDEPRRIVFTYGFVSGKPIAAGTSRVAIELESEGKGTRLRLRHDFADAAVRDEHVQGWRFQFSLFANVVSDEVLRDATKSVDRWLAVWSEPDAGRRERELEAIASRGVRMHDRYSSLEGFDDLLPHIAASQRFMPGLRLERSSDARQCQGMVLCDFRVVGADGAQRGTGSNVFIFDPLGRIEWVTGFWS